MKILPRAEFETIQEAHIELPILRSRTKPTKVMVTSVIGRPIAGLFDRKVWMQRVCELVPAKRNSYNVHISSNYEINYDLKIGE